jgi:acetyl esterase/lipase
MRYRGVRWVLCAALAAAVASPAAAQRANLPAAAWSAIAAMGTTLGDGVGPKTAALMLPLEASRAGLSLSRNLVYGDDVRQNLDLYRPQQSAGPAPVVVFVHGGGFVSGDKARFENIPAYFARHGMLGVGINYLLAPQAHWPAQSRDLGSAVAWLRANAARYGGDPGRIVVIGHSSGAAVVASYVFGQSLKSTRAGVVGAVLISGVYGYGPLFAGARQYYGSDPKKAEAAQPRAHLGENRLPLLIVTAEFDPAWLGAESHELAAALCRRDGKCPPFLWLGGHNHISEVLGIDTRDDRLGHTIRAFVRDVVK